MADSEKLTALKKAYAEIILNTAKEAAARIMVSERKAERYRRELVAAKEEALRMLLRLKNMLDSKASEAEMTSTIQQKRIEELELQLGEAEDIVKDLRSELTELQDELENLTNNERQSLAEQTSEVEIATQLFDESRLSPSGSVVSSHPILQYAPVVSLEMNSMPNGMYNGNRCCNLNGSCKDNFFLHNPDFASIVIRRKEPQLYRNGCTQRVRAYEGSLYGGSLTLSGQDDGMKNQIDTRDNEGDISRKLAVAAELCDVDKSSDEMKVVEPDENSCQARSFRKRKAIPRFKKLRSPSAMACPDMAMDNNVISGEDLMGIEDRSREDSESFIAPKSLSSRNGMLLPGVVDVSNSNADSLMATTGQSSSNNEKLADKLELNEQGFLSETRSELANDKPDTEMASFSFQNSDPKESNAPEVNSTPWMDKRFLKYTFQRKRKREFPSSPDGDSSVENLFLKRHMEGKLCESQWSQKSNLMTDSSGDKQ